jgi:hypothetical protein
MELSIFIAHLFAPKGNGILMEGTCLHPRKMDSGRQACNDERNGREEAVQMP